MAVDRIQALKQLYREGRHRELYGSAVSLVGELEASEGRRLFPDGGRALDQGGFWECAPVWARAMELALRGDATGLAEFLDRAPVSAGYIESQRRGVKRLLREMQGPRGGGGTPLSAAKDRQSLAALVQAGARAREVLSARVALAHALSLWVLNAEASGVDLTPHADCLFPDDYVPAPKVAVKEPVAVGAFSPSYVDDLRTSLTLVQEKLCRTQGELRESQAALKDAITAQVEASKADKPPTHDVRFGLPLPADCAAHSGPECGWLVTWHEEGARKTAILAAQWDRDYWSRKMATWVPLLRGLPCTWPVGGEAPSPYHVQHREEVKRLQDSVREANDRVSALETELEKDRDRAGRASAERDSAVKRG